MAFDTAAARECLARRDRERARRIDNLEARARNDAQAIITMLAEKYRPLRIVQWGSLLRPGQFRKWSDIDLAMEGLKDPSTACGLLTMLRG
jgi:predicted nucleotidyltransferase